MPNMFPVRVATLPSGRKGRVGAPFSRTPVLAGVHDSFWTHACDYEVLATVLREQFVELYSLPILANLKASLEREFLCWRIRCMPDHEPCMRVQVCVLALRAHTCAPLYPL